MERTSDALRPVRFANEAYEAVCESAEACACGLATCKVTAQALNAEKNNTTRLCELFTRLVISSKRALVLTLKRRYTVPYASQSEKTQLIHSRIGG